MFEVVFFILYIFLFIAFLVYNKINYDEIQKHLEIEKNLIQEIEKLQNKLNK